MTARFTDSQLTQILARPGYATSDRRVPRLPEGDDARGRALREIAASKPEKPGSQLPALPAFPASAARQPAPEELNPPAKRSKYGNVRVEGRGPNGERRVYDSAKEARLGAELNLRKAAGDIVSWVPQPSFVMGVDENGRDIRYRADALVIEQVLPNGTFIGRLLDAKGMDTQTSRAKRGALRGMHMLDVELVR